MTVTPKLRTVGKKEHIQFEFDGEDARTARIALAQEFYIGMPQLKGAARLGAAITVSITEPMADILRDALALYLATQAAEIVKERDAPASGDPR